MRNYDFTKHPYEPQENHAVDAYVYIYGVSLQARYEDEFPTLQEALTQVRYDYEHRGDYAPISVWYKGKVLYSGTELYKVSQEPSDD